MLGYHSKSSLFVLILAIGIAFLLAISSRADFNVSRNGVTWAYTFEGDVADLTASAPPWSVFDKNGFATESTSGGVYSYVSGSVGTSNSYVAPNWAGMGTARTAEIRLRVPSTTFQAADGSAAFTTSLNNAYDLRIYQDRVAYNGVGGLLDSANVVAVDLSDYRTLRAVVDATAPFVYSLYVDNDPIPVLERNDPWFNNFDSLMFGDLSTGGISGEVEVDYLSWTPGAFRPGAAPAEAFWVKPSGGDWNDFSNWSTSQVPGGSSQTAVLGNAATSPATVFSNSPITLETLRFDNGTSYAIAGGGTGRLQMNSESGAAAIEVIEHGPALVHQIQLPLMLEADTHATVGTNATLALNGPVDLGNFSLTKAGGGTLLLNNRLGAGDGNLIVQQGTLGGGGTLYGDLTVEGEGRIEPGASTGRMTLTGSYLQQGQATLAIELAGRDDFDVLRAVDSLVFGGGTLEVSLLNGYSPAPGENFEIFQSSVISGAFTDIMLPSGVAWDTSRLLSEGVLAVEAGSPGDFNRDGLVNLADYTVWRDTLGSSTMLDADGNGNNVVDQGDYLVWKSAFGGPSMAIRGALSVPEPATVSLTAIFVFCGGLATILGNRKRDRGGSTTFANPTCLLLCFFLCNSLAAATEISVTQGVESGRVYQRDAEGQGGFALRGTLDSSCSKLVGTIHRRHQAVAGYEEIRIDSDDNGNWHWSSISLPTGGPYSFSLQWEDAATRVQSEVLAQDVYVGDLWVLAGQSNMDGCGSLDSDWVENPVEAARYLSLANTWRVAEDPMHYCYEAVYPVYRTSYAPTAPGGRVPIPYEPRGSWPDWQPEGNNGAGLGLPFAKKLFEATGVPIGLVLCSLGGTTMEQWDPDLGDKGDESLYGCMLKRIEKVGGRITGMLWWQGESEYDATHYRSQMIDLIQTLRSDLSDPELPFLLVQLGKQRVSADVSPIDRVRVREIQRRLEDDVAGVFAVSAVDQQLSSSAHVDTEGYTRIGRRLAHVALREVYGHRDLALGPRVRRVWRDHLQPRLLHVEFEQVNGMVLPQENIVGFGISHASSPEQSVEITRAFRNRERDSVVDIQTVEAIPQDAELWYGFGWAPEANLIDTRDMACLAFGPMPVDTAAAVSDQHARDAGRQLNHHH